MFLFFLRSFLLSYVLSSRSRFRCTFLFLLASPSTHILHYNVSSLHQCLLFSFFPSPVFCLFPSIFHSAGSLLWSVSSSFFRLCLFISRYSIVCSLFSSIYLSLFSFCSTSFTLSMFGISLSFTAFSFSRDTFGLFVRHTFFVISCFTELNKKLLLSSISFNIAR